MADTDGKQPEVVAPPIDGKEKRKRNLLPPIRPGECLNPTGKNGRDKNKIVVDFLEAIDDKDEAKRPRIHVLLEAMYLRARIGHGVAMKYLGEQYTGRAKQQIELSGQDGGPITMANLTTEELRKMLEAQLAQPDEEPSDDEPPSGTGEPTT
jgi:hypothetical protein